MTPDRSPAAAGATSEPLLARLQQRLACVTDAALAVSAADDSGDVFLALAHALARLLQVDAALFAATLPEAPGTMRTLATVLDGKALRPFDYDIATSPCRHMLGRAARFEASGVHGEFAAGSLFHAKGMDAYAARSLVDAQGRQLGLVVVMNRAPLADREITETLLQIFGVRAAAELERRAVQAAAQASEQSYRAIFDAAEDAIFVHDWDSGAILDVSPKACELYGHPRAALLRLRVADISAGTPPYTEAEAGALIQRAKTQDEPLRFEWRARHRLGHLMWHEVTLKRARINDAPRILAFVRDITGLKDAAEALALRERQYRAMFDGSADAMVLWNAQLRIVDVNAAFTALYGYARDEVVGTTFGERLPRLGVEQRVKRIRAALAGHEGALETETVRKDGQRFEVEIRYVPIQKLGEPHALAIARDITERRRAEAALRASEAQYRAMFEAATDALQLLDAGHRVVDVNRAYERMYGRRRDEVIGKSMAELVPAAFRAERLALVQRALDGAVAELQTTGVRGDGTPFDMEVRCIPFEHHGQRHVLGIARDITARLRAERELRAHEEQYRAVFNASADALVLWDSSYRVVDVNPAFLRLYRCTREQIVGHGYPAHLPPEYVAQRLDYVRRALAGETSELLTHAYRHDGTRLDVELRVFPFEHHGEPHVLSIVRDVTDRLRSERRLRATIESAIDCVIAIDAEGTIQEFNPAAERCFGHQRQAVVGRSLAELVIPHRHRAAHAAGMARFRLSRTGPYIGRRVETTALRADGTEFPVELTIGVDPSPDGDMFIGYLRDITERKRAEDERLALEGQLRQAQKMEAIGQLTGGIAHDFNNILASIMGYVVLALERPAAEADPRLAEHLEQALTSCRRARDLIQQMLTFSRARHGEARTIALGSVVREAAQLLRVTLPATLALEVEPGDPDASVRIDPVQAQQVVLNLAINARDALAGSGRLALRVEHRADAVGRCASCGAPFAGSYVVLTVADDGPGIAPAVQARMFEPFFSTKAPGQGTGMGLATVHRVLHEHGGHVVVASAPGRGTRFEVLLPAASSSGAAAPLEEAAGRRSLPRFRGRVLLVDDEGSVLRFMSELLASWGLQVVTAHDGAAARALLLRDGAAFDLLLTDQTMPGLTGVELAAAARGRHPSLPVILYSGNPGDIEQHRAQLGLCQVLRKPVEPGELRAALAQCLAAAPMDGPAAGSAG